jgi:hypothetical protein
MLGKLEVVVDGLGLKFMPGSSNIARRTAVSSRERRSDHRRTAMQYDVTAA